MPDPIDPEPPFDTQAFIDALSQARFDRYLGFADGDQQRALELYSANVGLSQAFYVPLHAVEIALRNRINDCLAPSPVQRSPPPPRGSPSKPPSCAASRICAHPDGASRTAR